VSVKGLQHLSQIGVLELNSTPVTDAGLKHVSGLHKLRALMLDETLVTDEGLTHLAGLSNLVVLKVRGTAVTPDGVGRLQKALPHCRIEAGDGVGRRSEKEPATQAR
jgi:hypothetical protein